MKFLFLCLMAIIFVAGCIENMNPEDIAKGTQMAQEFLNEYPFSVWKQFPFMERSSDGFYRLKDQKAEIPLLFTLKATK